MIGPDGKNDTLGQCIAHPQDPHCTYTSFYHNTLVTLLDSASPKIGWKYYAPTDPGMWAAPTAITGLCKPSQQYSGTCTGTEYNLDMVFEKTGHTMPILDDINNCNLAPVRWVIPDKSWSDHGGEDQGGGPAYVATIVDAVGGQYNANKCNYWRNDSQHSVAILITWDDWGGWFDHVNPNAGNPPLPGVNQTSGSWGAFYTYGFRVPLLVVSPYTQAGFVSGNLNTTGGQVFPYVHDFGSILDLVEKNFSLPVGQIGPTNDRFADFHAPDNQPGNIPLQEFFQFPWRGFTAITGLSYDTTYFQTQGSLDGPDADDNN
jgi:phospholipase C